MSMRSTYFLIYVYIPSDVPANFVGLLLFAVELCGDSELRKLIDGCCESIIMRTRDEDEEARIICELAVPARLLVG